jgi:hypothetical protein
LVFSINASNIGTAKVGVPINTTFKFFIISPIYFLIHEVMNRYQNS